MNANDLNTALYEKMVRTGQMPGLAEKPAPGRSPEPRL